MYTESHLPTGWQSNGSFISETAQVSSLAHIAPMVVVGPGTIIRSDAVIQRCATIGAGVLIERACIVRPGATIGFRARLQRDVVVGAFCVLGSAVKLEKGARLADFATFNAQPEELCDDDTLPVDPIMTNVCSTAQLSKHVVLGLGARVGRAVLQTGVVIGFGGKVNDDSELGAFAAVGFESEVHGVSMGRRAQLGASGQLARHGLRDNESLLTGPFEHDLLN